MNTINMHGTLSYFEQSSFSWNFQLIQNLITYVFLTLILILIL